jgi:lipoprotein-releasing system permease protein
MRKHNVNLDIALTHIFTRKKQTMVAALGVMIGIAIYLLMNSLSAGFSAYSTNEIFKNNAHIKIYKEDHISAPLRQANSENELAVLLNPQILSESPKIVNPQGLLNEVKQQPFVTNAIAQINVDVFYNNGKSQLKGTANGVNILEADSMFNIRNYMIVGNLDDLQGNLDAIVIGKGIAENLNVGLDDYLTVSSSKSVTKLLKIKGIFSTGNSFTDKSKSYINLSTAQQFVKEGPSYVTTIYANTTNSKQTIDFAARLQLLTDYKVEPWQVTNADLLSGDKVSSTMMGAISFSILIVAAFGIYNILNMTVMQKVNDIAILKAIGFSGGDVIKIFVTEALVMGMIGAISGLLVGAGLIAIIANIYMGPPIGYFPIYFDAKVFGSSFLVGFTATLGAGYIPARKAARIDPVEIFRK